MDIITIREDKITKSGLRQNLCYTLLSIVEKLRDLFFQEKRDELLEELNKVLRCLKSNVNIIVSSVRYLLEKARVVCIGAFWCIFYHFFNFLTIFSLSKPLSFEPKLSQKNPDRQKLTKSTKFNTSKNNQNLQITKSTKK